MSDLLTTGACFAGVFAFVFIIAGLVGLQDQEPPSDSRAVVAQLCDLLAAGGVLSTLEATTRNWNARPEERRLVGMGIASGVGCFACLWLAARCP